MPIPLILGALAAAGLTGTAKGVKGAIDTKEAHNIQGSAEKRLRTAQSQINAIREGTNSSIQELGKLKLQVYANQINEFVEVYSKIKDVQLTDSIGLNELKKLNITNGSLEELKDTAISARGVLGGGIAGVGAGVLLGWGAYGGVMTLGTASTGTAIAGLSGVAATNATLAWLGGGAIAAGGGGMAMGAMVLGGIVAGPALLVAGGIFSAQAKKKLNDAYSNLAEAKKIEAELATAGIKLKSIQKNANQLNVLIKKLAEVSGKANQGMERVLVIEKNWSKLSIAEKNVIASAMKAVQVLKTVVDVPLLTDEGVLTKDIREVLSNKEILQLTETK